LTNPWHIYLNEEAKAQINNIRNEKREKTINTKEIQENIRTTLKTYIHITWKI
jgi:hypothetical protein